MRKIAGIIFSAVIFFCMCDTAECSSFLEFPDTMWGMSVQEVLDARKITEADTAGCSIQGRGPHFYIENCDVFGSWAAGDFSTWWQSGSDAGGRENTNTPSAGLNGYASARMINSRNGGS